MISILLIEDSPSDRRLLEEMLDKSFSVTWAKTRSDAIAQLEHQPFDVILLDLMLPDSLPPDTFITVKTAAPTTPVIILTGSVLQRFNLKELLGKSDSYLKKEELDEESLLAAINNACKKEVK